MHLFALKIQVLCKFDQFDPAVFVPALDPLKVNDSNYFFGSADIKLAMYFDYHMYFLYKK